MKYQVIGWSKANSNDFLTVNEINDDIKEAISKDIKSHHYLFNAFDHLNKESCVPVLNNYRKVVLEKDDFANLFASSFNYVDKNIFLDKELLNEKDKKYPSFRKTILERKDLFSKYKISKRLFGVINSFFLSKEYNHQNIFLYPVKLDDEHHFWINDRLILFNDLINEKIFGQILKLYSFKNKDEFINKINEIKMSNPKIFFGYSMKEIDKYSDKEFVILGFTKASAEDYLIDLDLFIRKSVHYNECGYELIKELAYKEF